MNASAREVRGTVVPTLRYRDVPAAIDWLCTAFGFDKHLVVTGDDGSVRYAQLAFGDGMIMLGSAEDSASDGLMAQPEETGGLETQICYLFVDDARAHCARAKAAGAAIVLDIDDEASDGRGYSCRDPEGHVWNFGTYDPRQRQSVRPSMPQPTPVQSGVKRLALVVGMLANAVTSIAFVAWVYAATEHTLSVAHASVPAHAGSREELVANDVLERAVREAREQLARERSAKETAERSARDARDQLLREKSSKEQAERAAAEMREQLVRERNAKAAIDPAVSDMRAALHKAERVAEEAREQLTRERGSAVEPAVSDMRAALEKAEQIAGEAREQVHELERAAQKVREEVALERSSREAAERSVADVKAQLGKERSAKEVAERAARQAREQLARTPPRKSAPKPKSSSESSGGAFSLWQ